MDIALPPLSEYPGIPGLLRRSQDHPGMDIDLYIYLPCLSIPGIPEYSDKGCIYIELCPSWDDPGIVRVSQESPDTQTREVELCRSRDDPGIVRVSQDTQTREVESYPSWEDPEMVVISQEVHV